MMHYKRLKIKWTVKNNLQEIYILQSLSIFERLFFVLYIEFVTQII